MGFILILLVFTTGDSLLQARAAHAGETPSGERVLLPEDRIVRGTVQDVRSGFMQVNIGEVEPLFLSVQDASERGISSLKPGEKLMIVVSDQNEVIDFHPAGQPGWDRVLKAHLAQPLIGDQRWAVIRTVEGKLEPYEVTEGARRKVLNIPVGVPAMFLVDKANIIIDATFGSERALLETLAQWSKDRQRIIH
ncbi:hypothetical protein [Nitrospira sp. Nam74]